MFGSSSKPVPIHREPPCAGAVAESVVPALVAMFGLRGCWYESFPFDVQLPRIEPGRIVLPPEEPGVAAWSGERGVELSVRHDDLTVGRYVLIPASPTCGVELSATARAQAISVATDVGARIAAAIVSETERA